MALPGDEAQLIGDPVEHIDGEWTLHIRYSQPLVFNTFEGRYRGYGDIWHDEHGRRAGAGVGNALSGLLSLYKQARDRGEVISIGADQELTLPTSPSSSTGDRDVPAAPMAYHESVLWLVLALFLGFAYSTIGARAGGLFGMALGASFLVCFLVGSFQFFARIVGLKRSIEQHRCS